ncbi:MAG: hypothetical protein PWQ72_1378, partial [Pseudothermotoga sp.]|nr:hypothetical protein [Pseudothermotoga sp.]
FNRTLEGWKLTPGIPNADEIVKVSIEP